MFVIFCLMELAKEENRVDCGRVCCGCNLLFYREYETLRERLLERKRGISVDRYWKIENNKVVRKWFLICQNWIWKLKLIFLGTVAVCDFVSSHPAQNSLLAPFASQGQSPWVDQHADLSFRLEQVNPDTDPTLHIFLLTWSQQTWTGFRIPRSGYRRTGLGTHFLPSDTIPYPT